MSYNKKHTDVTKIDNYNKFLISLDKNLRDNNALTLTPISTPLYKNNTDHCDEYKKIIDLFVQKINSSYNDGGCGSSKTTGRRLEDDAMLRNERRNPNMYRESVSKPNCGDHCSIKKHKSGTTSPTVNEVKIPIKETVNIVAKVNIVTTVNNIDDILKLIDTYKDDPSIQYNINMSSLHKIKEPLTALNNMIGMKNLKSNIVDQILFFVQNLHVNKDASGDFMHTVIYGPPGTGKTEVAKLMGSIYSKIGILDKGTFKKVTRSDLIAGYLGQTALKTRDVIKDALGGVLFIDEAYALGNSEKRDSFSKECIDTLCESLSDNKANLMVIIAGYEKELKDCFFNYNQGLDSRFTWRFKTDDYDAEDLYNIFLKKVKDIGWSVHENSNIKVQWFKKNVDYFAFFGRDMETLLAKTKIAHSKRVFCKGEDEKKKITLADLDKGFEMYLSNDDIKNKKEVEHFKKQLYSSIYS
jgi:SpoVK/Ycf46/Vps4 family AAA+-type ATPase